MLDADRLVNWICSFEHQMAFGKGRPTIISVDEGIRRCREFLQHPLAILTDLKLVSTTVRPASLLRSSGASERLKCRALALAPRRRS